MKRSFFQAAVVSILLYGCTTWTLTKRLERKLDGNYTRMLRAVLNKSWRQHPTRHQLYGHLPPPIAKTIQVRRTRHAGHCWRSKDELISDVLLWTPTYGCAKVGRPARTYIQQLCEDTGCNPEELPEAMNDREKRWERVRDIRAGGATWWWMMITIHLIKWLTNFYDFTFKWTEQQLEYTLLKSDCHSWWISKMQSGHEDTLEEQYAIKFCFKLGKNATETCGMLQTAFRPSCMNQASFFEWHKRFKEGRESVRDDERSGRIKEVNTPELIGKRVRVNMLRF